MVATGCFGICAKRAAVLASAASLNRGNHRLLADVDGSAQAGLNPDAGCSELISPT